VIYEPRNIDIFKEKAQLWASSFSTVCILDSNNYNDPFGSISLMIAVEKTSEFKFNNLQDFRDLQNFIDQHPEEIIPGYLSYDLEAYFFVPLYLLTFEDNKVNIKASDPLSLIKEIEMLEVKKEAINFHGIIKNRMSRQEYGFAFQKLQEHIIKGDIYEVNLCQEFYSENAKLNSFAAYKELNSISPTPFSCYFKHDSNFIISASPERFLSKRGNRLISQPIKGTAPRGNTQKEDNEIKIKLKQDPKEISENIMIVDLVRNDLTKSAKPGTVKVEELLGLYSFKQVHQLISTISCTLKSQISSTAAIQNTFPPGSMTGAPKISAMKLIDRYEKGKRGLYAGSIGYFHSDNDFDFNVVIRTIVYNSERGDLSFHVGGAITAYANEADEYQECLLKASAINSLLS
jgi:para-aminobenzoate synthetase component 1